MMKRRTWLTAVLFASLVMALCVFIVEKRSGRDREEAAEQYLQEHSLFENIVISGPDLQGSDMQGSDMQGSGTADNSSLKAGDVRIPYPQMEVSLHLRREGKWAAYVPADIAPKALIRFDHFQTLVLESAAPQADADSSADADPAAGTAGDKDSEGRDPGSADSGAGAESSYTLKSGDLFPAQEMENGSTWRARAIDRSGQTLEEADLVLYRAEKMPTLYINTASGSLDSVDADKTWREDGRYVFYTEDGKKYASGRLTLHGRGNSSWKEDKKQYSLNLASPRAVLGMEESKKFALVANTSDASKLRNKTAYDLAGLCGSAAAPQSVFVNVFFNGDYHGLYLLAQRPNAKGGSVHIADLESANEKAAEAGTAGNADSDPNTGKQEEETVMLLDEEDLEIHASPRQAVPENITGGYLLEIDGRYEDEDYWFSTKTHHFVVKYPEAVPVPEAEYIAGLLREAEKALYSEDGVNPDTGKRVEEYLDIDSWAKMYLLQDFLVQWDVESFSFFVYKDADDPLLYCGPVWDFDLSMGATGLGRLPNVMQRSAWLRDHREGWLTELEKHPVFAEAVRTIAGKEFFPALEAYMEGTGLEGMNRAESFSDASVPAGTASGGSVSERDVPETMPGFASLAARLGTSCAMDAHRWGKEDSFEESAQNLAAWLRGRAAFWRGYSGNPDAYCRVTFRYGFSDMDIYVPAGERLGFVPTEEYGEHLYSSFRKKYGEIMGWTGEDAGVLTEDTVIDHDQVFLPYSSQEELEELQQAALVPAEEIPIDFETLWQTSPDVYAWIRVPGTNIDYPVCQGGEDLDVDFYLSHRPDKTAVFAGSIYSQYYNARDFSDPVTVLYGHDMSDGSMFRTLHNFEDRDFFDANREVIVYLPDRVLHYRIFAAYHTDDAHILGTHDFFRDPAVFYAWMRDIFEGNSVYYGYVDESVGPTLTVQSRILTLSTCNSHEDQRYLVQCVLQVPQESAY